MHPTNSTPTHPPHTLRMNPTPCNGAPHRPPVGVARLPGPQSTCARSGGCGSSCPLAFLVTSRTIRNRQRTARKPVQPRPKPSPWGVVVFAKSTTELWPLTPLRPSPFSPFSPFFLLSSSSSTLSPLLSSVTMDTDLADALHFSNPYAPLSHPPADVTPRGTSVVRPRFHMRGPPTHQAASILAPNPSRGVTPDLLLRALPETLPLISCFEPFQRHYP